ncbi:GNAT family N-acetyltransferase [Deinococcus sp. HMF7620]|uniref:GNAT family N-acetyltransferase n=1 Tax=Deinococcus arboris TaxID=2682977 RepID=A0A7C9I3T8_9DEIO|nr:GNAT family N-acetyltransferase [Deinococcus arboris]MVN87691.1 GNAT family N-acetyltransferase [Deinococcus arboris]
MTEPLAFIDLGDGYSARPVSLDTYRDACARLEDQIFGGNSLYAFDPPVRSAPPLGETWNWGVYHGTELVGWHHAHARDERTVYMADTGLLPAHQGRGVYTRLLPHLLATFREAGFALVQSDHRATNTAVLVPKLRAGFHLQGLNAYVGGLNAALTLSLDDAYAGAMHVRSGFRAARGETARRLGLPEVPAAPVSEPPLLPLPLEAEPGTDLGGGYSLHRVTTDVYRTVYGQLEAFAYSTVSFDWAETSEAAPPRGPLWAWLLARSGVVVGWQASRAWDARTAYMVNTALLPAHRGQGVYRRLLPVVMAALHAEGYPLIRSHHHLTNNAVIVPKLRAGFRFQGLQVDEHGVMAVLLHSADPVYQAYMDVRSGLIRPWGEVARRLGLPETSEGRG